MNKTDEQIKKEIHNLVDRAWSKAYKRYKFYSTKGYLNPGYQYYSALLGQLEQVKSKI